MHRVPPDRAWWPAVGAPLERGVRRRSESDALFGRQMTLATLAGYLSRGNWKDNELRTALTLSTSILLSATRFVAHERLFRGQSARLEGWTLLVVDALPPRFSQLLQLPLSPILWNGSGASDEVRANAVVAQDIKLPQSCQNFASP